MTFPKACDCDNLMKNYCAFSIDRERTPILNDMIIRRAIPAGMIGVRGFRFSQLINFNQLCESAKAFIVTKMKKEDTHNARSHYTHYAARFLETLTTSPPQLELLKGIQESLHARDIKSQHPCNCCRAAVSCYSLLGFY
jgi:hypothetical protein